MTVLNFGVPKILFWFCNFFRPDPMKQFHLDLENIKNLLELALIKLEGKRSKDLAHLYGMKNLELLNYLNVHRFQERCLCCLVPKNLVRFRVTSIVNGLK